MKNIINIQKEYYELFETYFKDELDKISKIDHDRRSNYIDYLKNKSIIVQTYPKTKTSLEIKFERFYLDLEKFWQKYTSTIIDYCTTTQDTSVIVWMNEPVADLAPKLLLYYDTILIPDALNSFATNVIKAGFYRDAFFYFLILREINPLLNSNTDKPLLIIVPYEKGLPGHNTLKKNKSLNDEYLSLEISNIAKSAYQKALNIEFHNETELNHILTNTPILRLNTNMDIEFIKSLLHFIIEDPTFMQYSASQGKFDFIVSNRLSQRQMTIIDFIKLYEIITSIFAVYEAREYNVESLSTTNLITNIHIPYANFKFESLKKVYGQILSIPKENLINYSLSEQFDFVDHIDLSTAINLRTDDILLKLRSIIKDEANKIKSTPFKEFPLVAKEFEKNVKRSIDEEIDLVNNEIQSIQKKKKITTLSFLTTAGLTLGAFAFPALLPLGIISAGYGVLAGASIKDIINDVFWGNEKLKELNKSPLSLIIKKT